MSDQTKEWVIVVDRCGWMGSVPYSQPVGIFAERYASIKEAEAACPPSCFVAEARRWSHLPEVPR